MSTLTITLPRLHPRQSEIKSSAKRFNVLNCGRRFGKTTLGIDLVSPALHGYPVGWFSPTYKLLLEAWRDISRIYKPVSSRVSSQEKRIELITGGLIEMWSLDASGVALGRKYKNVVIDEAAKVSKLQEIWQEDIRPTLTDYQGGAWFLSTPKGLNFFKELFDRGRDPLQKDWQSWQLSTSANPFISKSEIEAAKQELPERVFRQEYLAEFIEDAGIFRRVFENATLEPSDLVQDTEYVFGVDWGKHNDFTVISVLDSTDLNLVYLDRFNQIDYTVQVARLKALYEKFKPIRIVAESNAMGEPLIEQLYRSGLPVEPFHTTNASKAKAIDSLSLAFEKDEIKIINDPVLISELQAFEATRLPSGLLRYSAPEGYHDDTVISLMLAWFAATEVKWKEVKFLSV